MLFTLSKLILYYQSDASSSTTLAPPRENLHAEGGGGGLSGDMLHDYRSILRYHHLTVNSYSVHGLNIYTYVWAKLARQRLH